MERAEQGIFDVVPEDRGTCDIDALDDLETLDLSSTAGPFVDAVPLEVLEGDRSCVGDGDSAFVVARPVGAGRVIGLGGPSPLLNEKLGERDNAVLAAALVAPEPGGAGRGPRPAHARRQPCGAQPPRGALAGCEARAGAARRSRSCSTRSSRRVASAASSASRCPCRSRARS